MPQVTKTKSESIHFAGLFFKGHFEVPWHQRRYDWKAEHVATLLRDIDYALKNKQNFYFLGALSLIDQGNSTWGINDGQQRMTTYALICACFLRLFHDAQEGGDEAMAMRILFDLTERQTRNLTDADNLNPRLIPSQDDKPRFNLFIRGKNVGTNGKLTQAWEEIDKFVSALSIEKALEYFKFLTEKVEVSFLTIPADADPNMIFEALNFRGKPLDDFDLIRNHFYSFFNAPAEESRRETIKSNLEETLRHQLVIGNSDKIMDYARCYLQCEYGFLPKNKFYRSVRDNMERAIKDCNEKPSDYVFKLVDKLTDKRYVQIFNAIARQDHNTEFIERFNVDARRAGKKRNLKILLDELRTYTITPPILLALLSRYAVLELDGRDRKSMATKIYNEISTLNAFVMRTALVERKFEPSHFESDLSDLASKIFTSNSVEELSGINIWGRLKDLSSSEVLDDKLFIESLKTIEIRAHEKSKRFLFTINTHLQSDADTILYNQLTLEHLLPKGSEHWDGWKGFEENGHDLYINRIGNLTLLGNDDNKSSNKGNANWKVKKPTLESSMFSINKYFSDIDDWTPESIEKRQEELAKLAAKIWSFKHAASEE